MMKSLWANGFTFVFAIVLALVIAASASAAKKLNFASMLDTYSLEQTEQISTYLLARVEADPLPKGQKIIKCDPPMTKVNAWLAGTVKQLVDERRKREVDLYVRDTASYLSRVKGCSDRCTCGAYEAVFEQGGTMGTMDAKAHAANVKALKQEMRKSSPKLLRKCAERVDWFCNSDLEKYLMSPAGAKAK